MRPNGGAYPELDSRCIEGGLGRDEEGAEGVVLVTNHMLLTVELREGLSSPGGAAMSALVTQAKASASTAALWCRAAGALTREGSGEGGLDRRGGLSPSLEESSSAVGAILF